MSKILIQAKEKKSDFHYYIDSETYEIYKLPRKTVKQTAGSRNLIYYSGVGVVILQPLVEGLKNQFTSKLINGLIVILSFVFILLLLYLIDMIEASYWKKKEAKSEFILVEISLDAKDKLLEETTNQLYTAKIVLVISIILVIVTATYFVFSATNYTLILYIATLLFMTLGISGVKKWHTASKLIKSYHESKNHEK